MAKDIINEQARGDPHINTGNFNRMVRNVNALGRGGVAGSRTVIQRTTAAGTVIVPSYDREERSFTVSMSSPTSVTVTNGRWTAGNKTLGFYTDSPTTITGLSAASTTYYIVAYIPYYGDRRFSPTLWEFVAIQYVAVTSFPPTGGSSGGNGTMMLLAKVVTNSNSVIESVTQNWYGGDITDNAELSPFKISYMGTDATNHNYRVRRGWWIRNGVQVPMTKDGTTVDYTSLTIAVGSGGDHQVILTLDDAFSPTSATVSISGTLTPEADPQFSSTARCLGIIQTQTLHYWIEQFVTTHIDDTWGASGSFTTTDGKTVTVTNGIITSIV